MLSTCRVSSVREPGNGVHVAPPEALEAEQAADEAAGVEGACAHGVPPLPEQIEHRLIVGKGDPLAVALAPVEHDERRERERHGLGQPPLAGEKVLEGGEDAGLPFGQRVQRDRRQPVPDRGIALALHHLFGVLAAVAGGGGHHRDDLALDQPAHVGTDDRVGHGLPRGLQAAEIGHRRHGGLHAVQDADLALAVRRDAVEQHVQPRPIGGKHVAHGRRALDHPDVEALAEHHQLVAVAELRGQLRRPIARIAGDDPVDEGVAEGDLLLDPGAEPGPSRQASAYCSTTCRSAAPLRSMSSHGRKTSPLPGAPPQGLVPALQKEGHLGRERAARSRLRPVLRVESDAGFGRVREAEPEARILGELEEVLPALVRAQSAAHAADDPPLLERLAIAGPGEQRGVEAVLPLQDRGGPALDRLHDGDSVAEAETLVHDVDHPVGEGAQKVALSELDHSHGQPLRRGGPASGQCLHATSCRPVLTPATVADRHRGGQRGRRRARRPASEALAKRRGSATVCAGPCASGRVPWLGG